MVRMVFQSVLGKYFSLYRQKDRADRATVRTYFAYLACFSSLVNFHLEPTRMSFAFQGEPEATY